jgi:uncharacterized protein (DUF1501 family)
LGVKRQHFVSIGGFDTHGDQFKNSNNTTTLILSGAHADLRNNDALSWFYNRPKRKIIWPTMSPTFTMSDFGRTPLSLERRRQ